MTLKILKILAGLVGLFLVFMGLQWIFVPSNLASDFAIVSEGIRGMSTLRADLGSFFLCMGVISILGIRKSEYSPALFGVVALFMGVAAFARLVGFVMDGFIPETFTPFVVEIVFVILYVALMVLVKKQDQSIVTETSETSA